MTPSQRRYAGAALAVAFAALLLYATLRSVPPSAPAEREHQRAVEQACTRAVQQRTPGARIPFAPRLTELDPSRSRVEGVVDAPSGGEMVRSNFGCIVERKSGGRLHADSVWIWRSH